MNVIVSNKQKSIIDNANIDAIKDLTGLFNVDDLIAKFKNYFFSKMILDVTSVENFTSKEVLQKLVDGIGSDRLILLLPQSPLPPDEFKKMLINLKIYNFSNEISDVVRYIDNPQTYETALRELDGGYQDDSGYVDNSIRGMNEDRFPQENDNDPFNNQSFTPESFNSAASLEDAMDSFNIKSNGGNNNYGINESYNIPNNDPMNSNNSMDNSFNMANMNSLYNLTNMPNNGNPPLNEPNNALYNVESENIADNYRNNNNNGGGSLYNMMNNVNAMPQDNNVMPMPNIPPQNNSVPNMSTENKPNGFVFLNVDGIKEINSSEKKVIGFKNLTNHAGSTTFIYMILKVLNDNLRKDVLAIEINHDDFKLFMNNRMVRIEENEVRDYLASRHEKIILVDLNECQDTSFCDKIIYLLEPSTIMLNKLMVENQQIFNELKDKAVVLNKSMLSNDDVSILANEAGINFVYNMKPLNDRINNDEIINFVNLLGIK